MDNRGPVDFPNIVASLLTVGIVVVDRRFNVLMWNRFMELNSNFRSEDVVGHNIFDFFPELNRNWLEKKIRSCLILKTASFSSWKQRPYLFRFKPSPALSGESEFMYQDASIFPVYDANGIVQGACITIHDTTEVAEALRLLDRTMDQALDLEELNRRDGLTGLYNRKFFDEQITQEILSARRYKWPLALAMIDIDNFKDVNDNYGHVVGDAVLHGLALCLQGMLRSSDTLCRYGGEEFALILPQISPQNSNVLMERLRKAIQAMQVDASGGPVKVTISVGIASLDDSLSAGQLVVHADEALYQSKHGGRNRVTAYSEQREAVLH
ncbi:MAG: GGDEF domain-containing protein [Burkholderiaceae bacterium]|nr:GGDEF domain-containing protein [Burkholderiaceae bacterium]